MTVIIKTDWPLENLLRDLAQSRSGEFPDAGINYFERYVQIKQAVADKYYQATGTGLAAKGQRFTKHDIGHVDDVIRTAGHFLGIGQSDGTAIHKMVPFEVFALLYAIVLHDAGNAYGREGHEARAFKIMQDLGALCPLDSAKKQLVASIAKAHGGKTVEGKKDTIDEAVREEISHLEQIGVHGRRLAAVLRMADELSENPRRCDEIALEKPSEESYLPNFYCKCVGTNINSNAGTIRLKYTLFTEQLASKYKDPESEGKKATFIVDYIRKRLGKCNLERRYCNRFLHSFAYMPFLIATIDIFDIGGALIEQIPIELSEKGYPKHDSQNTDALQVLNGSALKRKYAGGITA
jgi:hypothetical protein